MNYPYTVSVNVSFRDIDALGHVNNAVYLTYFEQARIGYGLQLVGGSGVDDLHFVLAEATVSYLRPVFFGDVLEIGVRVGEIGTKSFVMDYSIQRQSDGELIARGRTVQVWYNYQTQRSQPVPDSFRAAVARDNERLRQSVPQEE
ncbi:MAG TPA: thioesterase family protein [Herpetosiphonaceae bacterium]